MRSHNDRYYAILRRKINGSVKGKKPLSLLLTNASVGAKKLLDAHPEIDLSTQVKPTGKNGNLIKNDLIALI